MEINRVDCTAGIKHGNNHLRCIAITLQKLSCHIIHPDYPRIENTIRRLNTGGNFCNLLRLQLLVNRRRNSLYYCHNISCAGSHALACRQLRLKSQPQWKIIKAHIADSCLQCQLSLLAQPGLCRGAICNQRPGIQTYWAGYHKRLSILPPLGKLTAGTRHQNFYNHNNPSLLRNLPSAAFILLIKSPV